MSRVKTRPGTAVVSQAVSDKVAAVAARVGLTREQALAIAAAEPRGTTVFAGSLKSQQQAKRHPRVTTVHAKRATAP